MRAARLHDYRQPFQVDEVAVPDPGPGEVLVKIAGSGACHSDLHVRSGELPMLPELPFILGHENAGHVEALGPGALGFEVGEPVLVYGGWGCGHCRLCLAGDEQVCDVMRWGGIGRPGGYAEYMVVPATRHLVRIPDLDPVDAAPLTDAALTPYRAFKKALPLLRPGSTVMTIGVGGLGHYGVQYLAALTAARVVAVDIAPAKRQLAQDLGADVVLDPTSDDVAEEIVGMTGGRGAAAALDFVGLDATLALAMGAVGPQGLVVLVGLAGGSVPFSFMGAATEVMLTTSNWGNRNELEEVVELARRGDVKGHVERHPLSAINEVFDRLEAGEIDGRAVLTP
jgi:propanol-preferring alcohol dehydrogenase